MWKVCSVRWEKVKLAEFLHELNSAGGFSQYSVQLGNWLTIVMHYSGMQSTVIQLTCLQSTVIQLTCLQSTNIPTIVYIDWCTHPPPPPLYPHQCTGISQYSSSNLATELDRQNNKLAGEGLCCLLLKTAFHITIVVQHTIE